MRENSAGTHLMVDGYVSDPKVFASHHLKSLFPLMAHQLEMTLLAPPVFYEVAIDPSKMGGDVFRDEGGVTAFAVVSTSHISVHCWPLQRFFSLDVFSCKDFDPKIVLKLVTKFLGVGKANSHMILRVKPKKTVEAA